MLVLILSLFAVVVFRNPPDSLIKFIIQQGITRNHRKDTFEDDGLYVITTGTGAPLPDINRVGSQTVVLAGDQTLLFDAGPGSTLKLEMSGIGTGSADALFLTHYHSDHIGDIGELMLKRWASETVTEALPIYGPIGLDQVVEGFEIAYELDKGYRIDHHGEEIMPSSSFGGNVFEFDLGDELTNSEVVYKSGDVEVIAFNVDHKPVFPAVGYRVNYKDRSVVISGDTIYLESLIEHTMGADLFVCEALSMKYSKIVSEASADSDSNLGQVAQDIQDYHISPEQAAMIARDAGVDQLLITHFLPPVPLKILKNGFIKEAKDVFNGGIYLANDGTMIKLPSNSDEIKIIELLN
ncbi:MBL fold metallo-hydrolase [Clostridium grantii]|uniref:MBL fold metallo-hydrolase n=1 Tax=Clostridium grantii TaxID=40575 RepID=UPI001356487C|nr:MBL fold metallo-hydrolase [Clostridium grantii]